MADSQAVKSLNNSKGKGKYVFEVYTQRFKHINFSRKLDKVKAEPSFKEQNKQEITERLALEAAKKEVLTDDHDDAFMVDAGSKTSVLGGGGDTEHAYVGGCSSGMPPSKMVWLKKCDDIAKEQSYPEFELEDDLLVEKGSDKS